VSLPLDAGRLIRAGITAALIHDTYHHDTPEGCEAAGWKLRASCTDRDGRATCPLCRQRVTTSLVTRGVVRIDPHLTTRGDQ
jgi:hypothetical protein